MAEPSGTHELEALLEHTAWLRGLARALVGEAGGGAAAADDLVQDAFVAALERRAPPSGSPRSWLAGVLRNLARRRRRTEGRRAQREREHAPADLAEDAAEVLARADLQRRLIEHVFALPEPYRTALLLRFFEGLDGADIARRLGVPSSTVRTRVARGLEQLRARLDAEHGGARGVWSAAFAPLALWSGASPGATGIGWEVLGMGVKAKLATAAVVVGLAATAIVLRARDRSAPAALEQPGVSPPALAAAGGSKPEGEAAPAVGAPGAASVPDERRVLEGGARAAEPEDLGVLVFGSLLGANGELVSDGFIDLVDAQGRSTHGSVGAPGSWSALGLLRGNCEIHVEGRGFVETTASLAIPEGAREVRRDLRLEPALSIPVRFTDETGAPLKLPGLRRVGPSVVATREPPPSTLPGAAYLYGPSYGCATYEGRSDFRTIAGLTPDQAGMLHLRAATPLWVSAVLRDQVLETRRLEGPVDELEFRISVERAMGLLGGIRLRVIDAESGEPLAGARVSLEYLDSSGSGAGATTADGRAELMKEPPGLRVLNVTAPGRSFVRRTVRVPAGSIADLGDVPLRTSATIAGKVVDERGEPVATSLVSLPLDGVADVQDDGSYMVIQSAVDGSFRFDCGRGRIVLRLASDDWACDPVVVDASSPVEGLVVQARRGVEVRFRTRTPGPGFTLATQAGMPFLFNSFTTRLPQFLRLSPGPYQLLVSRGEEAPERIDLIIPPDPRGDGIVIDLPPWEPVR